MNRVRLKWLLEKYIDKTASLSEMDELSAYVDGASDEEMMSFMEDVYQTQKNENDIFLSYQRTRMLNAILPNSDNYKEKLSIYKKSWFKFSAVAALLLITLTIGILFYNDNGFSEQNLVQQDFPLDIKPGGNKATLTLADGSVISLSETNAGKIAEQQGIVITKTDDGQILYTVDTKGEGSSEAEIVFNTIATPRGGQFQVILPDGTKVWLNAESSLKYPTVFSSKERKVELLGEGYFEVAKNENLPFIVITEDQAVTVLGTHFNINSYTKYNTETTLVEGSVKVSSVSASSVSKILKPGEQSVLNSQNKFNIKRVNLENAIAWKNGFFNFEGSSIKHVMEELARWYDFDFEFEGKVPSVKLWGKVYRNVNVSEALDIFSYFNLKYRIVNNNSKNGTNKKVIISQL